MKPRYASAAALRRALLDRLRNQSLETVRPIHALLAMVLMERFLARLFVVEHPPWLLKGGYALELRYPLHARTTRDLDLSICRSSRDGVRASLDGVHAALVERAGVDLGDFLRFEVHAARKELTAAPFGGATYPVQAQLGSSAIGEFHVDVALDELPVPGAERRTGADVLGFAGVPPATVGLISTAQQFVEKLHAYTLDRKGRSNTRVKDLVDMVMILERESLEPSLLLQVAGAVFSSRQQQPVPLRLDRPPADWRDRYGLLAAQARVRALDLDAGFELLEQRWSRVWDADSQGP